MGVADKQTYKDQKPYFSPFKVTQRDLPSINGEPSINTTIKENPDRSNVEIEGGELVLQPDLSALFKAIGKKHKSGGMDVLLRPNSFVYSDDKSLAFSQKDHELYELKEGGKTPAEVVKKNVSIKHYNTLVNNLSDIKKDDLAKKSSAMMLEKYIQTLGNIAFRQEEKKDFPTGLPDFSVGTAPVYNPQVKAQVMESKQFAKYGGKIIKMQPGGGYPGYDWRSLLGPKSNPLGPKKPNQNGQITPTSLADYTGYNPATGQFLLEGQLPADAMTQSLTGQPSTARIPGGSGNATPGVSGVPRISGVPQRDIQPTKVQGIVDMTTRGDITADIKPSTLLGQESLPPGGQGMKRADWEFTPWQKLSQAYNWFNYANVKRYMPYRSNYDATYADPSLLNPEQAVGDVRASANQQINSLNTLNPILRNAQASGAYGQALQQIPGIRSQYDNQNAQITNQFRQYNNQIKNQETMQNLGFDQQYYQQAVTGRQNFDNMRTFTANQAMNNLMRDVETNQKLSYNLLTQNNPAYGFDWKSGNFTRNPKSVLDVPGRTAQDSWEGMVGEIEKLKRSGLSDNVISAIVRGRFFQQAAPYFQQSNTPPPFKKGGKYRGNNIKY